MIAFLILAHDHPQHVLRLARRLREADDSVVAIHYDARSGPFPATDDDRIVVVPDPVAIRWGDISVVDAVLHALAWLERERIPYDWLALLSGHDYPLVAPCTMEAVFTRSGGDGFIEHDLIEARFAGDNATRYEFAYVRLPSLVRSVAARCWRLNQWQDAFRVVVTRAGAFFGWRSKRPFGKRLRARRGSGWWVLSRRVIDEVSALIAHRPGIRRAYARKLIPDESFMPTLAAAGTYPLTNANVHFIRWPGDEAGSPLVLTAADVPAMLSSGALFARKFDVAAATDVLDLLDRHQRAVCTGHGCETGSFAQSG
jgi:hypothetical protein